MATYSKSSGLFAAVCALLSLLSVPSLSQAATLAEWTLTSNAKDYPEQACSSKVVAIESALLSAGSGITKNTTANSFGGSSWHEGASGDATVSTALNNNNYLQISFTTANGYNVAPQTLEYTLRARASTSPTVLQWVCITNSAAYFMIGDEIDFSSSSTASSRSISLAALWTLPPETDVKLLLAGWGTDSTVTKTAGTLNFTGTITLTGTATETSGGDVPAEELAIATISNKTATVGTPLSFAVPITIPEGMTINPGVSADKAIEGECSFDGTTFSYSPTKDDVDLSPITFTVSATNAADSATFASEGFAVTVSRKTETLASWAISGSLKESATLDATTPLFEAIEAARLSRGAAAAGSTDQFGATGFRFIDSFEEAVASNKYLQVSIQANGNYRLEPALMDYNIIRTKTGPTNFQWMCIMNGISTNYLGSQVLAIDKDDNSSHSFQLDLSPLGTLPLGTTIELRVYAWGVDATQNTGTFCFNKPGIEVKGYAEKDETVIVPPSVVAIRDQVVFVGETNRVAVAFSGDMQYAVATNCSAVTSSVSGTTWMDGATACFAPTDADADLAQPIELKVTLDVSLDVDATYDPSATYAVTVLRKPVLEITNGGSISENFDSMGTGATAALPPAWSFAGTAQLWNNQSIYDSASGAITLAYDVSVTNTAHAGGLGGNISSAGYWNFGAGIANEATDRAPGFYSTSNTSTGLRTASLIAPLKNVGTSPINSFKVSYSIEKYKSGHGKTVELRLSRDGHTWLPIPAESDFKKTTEDDKDGDTIVCVEYGSELPPPISVKGKIALDTPLVPGETLYLGWFCYATSGSAHSSVQALAIDDVRIRAGNPEMTVIMVK